MNTVDQLVHTTIRIETDGPSGKGSGTGFFVQLSDDGNTAIPVIVTNKHVVSGASSAVLQFTEADPSGKIPKIGSLVEHTVTSDDSTWFFHGDQDVDLCVMPIKPLIEKSATAGRPIFYRAFNHETIADDQFMETLVAVEDVLMIGYPSGLWDSINNFPITRRGVTATPPAFGFEGKKQFVLDCACFPGSSGSPIILYNPASFVDKSGGGLVLGGGRIKLLGILWGGPQFDSIGEVKVLPVPTSNQAIAHSRIPMNLGYCVRASQLFWFEEQIRLEDAAKEEK